MCEYLPEVYIDLLAIPTFCSDDLTKNCAAYETVHQTLHQ